jgi:hypothetical protein
MARLTYSERKNLPKSDFAVPSKRQGGKGGYPIPDKSHARNALARVSQFGSPAQKAEVRAKVHAKYPGIGEKSMKHEEKRSHHGATEGLHKRGHHESHLKEHEKGGLSHKEFEQMDHGGKHDHYKGSRGRASVGFLAGLLITLSIGVAFAAYNGISPYGIFGGVATSASLPTSAIQGTWGFTSDKGAMVSNGSNFFTYEASTGPTFSVTSGCGTVGTVTGGATAGSFTAGATSCAPVISLPTAPNGWVCEAWDLTTNTDTLKQTADTATSCTLSGTVASADVIVFLAKGF